MTNVHRDRRDSPVPRSSRPPRECWSCLKAAPIRNGSRCRVRREQPLLAPVIAGAAHRHGGPCPRRPSCRRARGAKRGRAPLFLSREDGALVSSESRWTTGRRPWPRSTAPRGAWPSRLGRSNGHPQGDVIRWCRVSSRADGAPISANDTPPSDSHHRHGLRVTAGVVLRDVLTAPANGAITSRLGRRRVRRPRRRARPAAPTARAPRPARATRRSARTSPAPRTPRRAPPGRRRCAPGRSP